MTHRKRNTLLLTLSATAVAATLTAAPAPAQARDGLGWKPCAPSSATECATLSVPLDYRDPHGRQLDIAVARLSSDNPKARRGTLLLIPGGPGGSGLGRLASEGEELRKRTGGAYDIVSLDPRGVGASTRADCDITEDDRELTHLLPWPAPDGNIGENADRARRIARACADNGGDVMRSLSTANEVRDIDRLRQALGEEKLSAWGRSYGAYVAAVYAQKYPSHTDRWLLDSSGDPDPQRVARGWSANKAAGLDVRFPDFARWATDPVRAGRLRLGTSTEEVRASFLAIAAQLDGQERRFADGHALTGNRLRQALQQTLDDNDMDAFESLGALIVAARDTTGPITMADPVPRVIPGPDATAMVAVICNDVAWPSSVGSYARDVTADRARHPLTAGMPVNITPCAFWKDRPAEKPTRITADGPSNVLMVQNLRDPSTPYAGALKMREALGERARLVSVNSGGHGAYLANGNACGDRAVTDFLTTGRRPERDVTCG
ncbi:alpha/beta hydrolase [Streptomyces sp. NPDC049577]|uniref:alpha/beta hydrolase n=1 Tax=Streptomyces sp. NPDC049577 TaxID=3155153 RepID=UPI00343B389E